MKELTYTKGKDVNGKCSCHKTFQHYRGEGRGGGELRSKEAGIDGIAFTWADIFLSDLIFKRP
jgi:hypothetical protein